MASEAKCIDLLLVNPPMCSDRSGRPTAPEKIGINCGVMPPTQLLKLATVLQKHGITAKVIDLALFAARNDVLLLFDELLSKSKVQKVGFSNHTVINLDVIAKLARLAKRHGAEVIVGGINATHMQGEIFQYVPDADVVFVGFAEKTLLDYIVGGKISKGVLTKENALIPRSPADLAKNNSDARESLELVNEAVKPDLNLLLFLEEYVKAGCIYPIETQRGCEFSCNFCVSKMLLGGSPLRREIEGVIKEMKTALQAGFTEFFFTDNTLTGDKSYISQLCHRMIEEDICYKTKNVLAMTRVDAVDPSLLALLAESGFTGLGFGVETAGKVQELGKGIAQQQHISATKAAFSAARQYGIEPTAFLMVGSPIDTEETLSATLEFCKEGISQGWLAKGFATISKFIPVPGSIYYYWPEKFGIRKLTRENFANAWFFCGSPVTATRYLSVERIAWWHDKLRQELQCETIPQFELMG